MKKVLLSILLVLFALDIRINAAEDFCVNLDMNAFGYEAFSSDGWKTDGDVSVINQNFENLLKIGTNSNVIYTPTNVISNNSVVFTASLGVEKSDGFLGVYMNNESGKTCCSIGFMQNGVISVYTGGAWKALVSYESGVLYDIKCVIDSQKSKFSVSINGVEYIKDAPMRSKPGIKELKIYTEKTSGVMKNFSLYSGKVSGIKINSSPVYGCENIASGRDEFEISFSVDMNPDSLNSETIILRDKNGVDFSYKGEYIAQKRSFVLRPDSLYNEKNGLRIVVKGGDAGVRAADGSKISGSSYILDFNVIKRAVTISDIRIKEENENIKLSFSVENMCDIIKKQKVIIAGYSYGKLVGLRTYSIEGMPHSSSNIEIEYTGVSEDVELYAYIFDLEDMIPVCERIKLKSQEMSE